MGIESGEGLQAIIRRKNWERKLGNGIFYWGIGQSLGLNAQNAALSNRNSLKAIFSPMISKAKAIDRKPEKLFLWNDYISSDGSEIPLPSHAFITSRADLPSGRLKSAHYALICSSRTDLTEIGDITLDFKMLTNFSSERGLGPSQVTAVVKKTNIDSPSTKSRYYPVSFITDMLPPYTVRLSNPTILSLDEVEEINSVTMNGDILEWSRIVRNLRSRAKVRRSIPVTGQLF
ncbi:hypothetical protein ACQKEF_23655 [Pseudomonas oryzihabitans]|uniref:hypothetical protein n=1 Tax=Pseudomonas oryzihabitans TaxID=47885 RepID=UPI003D0391F3